MRFKVGNSWFFVGPAQALMIELTEADKKNIAAMVPGATKYAAFDDHDPRSNEERLAWMDDAVRTPARGRG